MKITLASDHAGFQYKEELKAHLSGLGHEVLDCGTDSKAPVDYPDFVHAAASAIAAGDAERGIVLGGSGNGEAMVANRWPGVRCAVCWDIESSRLARCHNDANMIALGQRMMPLEMALAIVDTWLETPFDGGRHVARILKIDQRADER